jgi:F0F1-type ATP synthase delta subunit
MKTAKILCAPNVSDDAFRYLCDKLTARFGEVTFERETRDDLVGGFTVLLDGNVYDMSLRTQLDALRADCEKEA